MQEQGKIIIDEDGNPKIDWTCGSGPTCEKEIMKLLKATGSKAVKVVKKPEFYRASQTEKKKETN